jgi:hypothetical protein
MNCTYTVCIEQPGLYQVVNGDLVPVQSVDYTNQNWISITSPSYVTIINGNIENVSTVGTCGHTWELYHGLVESYEHCIKCGICKKEERYKQEDAYGTD